MTRRTCPRCAGAFYGICRKCEAPLSTRTCRRCGASRSSDETLSDDPWERTTFFCPGGAAGPHVETTLTCDCCSTVLVITKTARGRWEGGSDATSTWKPWSLAGGSQMDLCPECFARLTAIIAVAVDELFTERAQSMARVRWRPPAERVQYQPTRHQLERSSWIAGLAHAVKEEDP